MRKKLLSVVIIFIVLLINIPIVYGHSGRTDANGGHYNRSTGEYHYHHGYPAHQHYNGVCPYLDQDKDDKRNSNKSESDYSSNNYSNNKSSNFKYSLDDENTISFDTIINWFWDNIWWMFWVIIIIISCISNIIDKFHRKK